MPASALINVMTIAARKAGRALSRDFGEVEQLQVSVKGPANFVTKADHKAEDIVFKELSKTRPGYGFLMEERGEIEGTDKTNRWIVDPLDGTTNFLHGLPLFAVSIALEREGQIAAGVIYNPISDEMYTAEKGKGAFLNDRRIRVSARRNMSDALLACDIPHPGKSGHARFRDEMSAVTSQVAGLRHTGAACIDLAWTAAGRFDAYWERGLEPWDMAAGIIMVREAGGLVTDSSSGSDMLGTGTIAAGNPQIQRGILKLVQDAG